MAMKNLITSAFLLLALLLPGTAAAFDFEVDGIYYVINGNQATVTSGTVKYTGDVTIPATVTNGDSIYSVTAIGDRAFSYCYGLKSVNIPESITTLGTEAFSCCYNLTSVTIPNSVTSIGWGAIYRCSQLRSIIVENGNTVYDSRDNCNAIIETASNTLIAGCKNSFIPNSIIAIGNSAFAGCNIYSMTIPNSVVSIGNRAFFSSDLRSVTIGSSVAAIGEGVFSFCSLARIVVDSCNTTFDSRDNCNAIIKTANNTLVVGGQNTIIPNTVTAIGVYAFDGCRDLTSIVIPNSVTSISGYAFQDCYNLTSVVIPNSVTSIYIYAFHNCYRLESLTIPHSVTRICLEAFGGCSSLKDVYSYITDPLSVDIIGDAIFTIPSGNYSGRTLHVPYGTVNAYQVNEHWFPYFEQIVEMDPEMELIGDVNFDGQIDIADINAIIDIMITWYAPEADVNRDGEVTIADINAIVDIIMGANEGLEPEPEHE